MVPAKAVSELEAKFGLAAPHAAAVMAGAGPSTFQKINAVLVRGSQGQNVG